VNRVERLGLLIRGPSAGEHEQNDGGMLPADDAASLPAVELGHVPVDPDGVGLQFADEFHAGVPVGCLADHLQVRRCLDHRPHDRPHGAVVVHEDHAPRPPYPRRQP
jgi:hypothetical protein